MTIILLQSGANIGGWVPQFIAFFIGSRHAHDCQDLMLNTLFTNLCTLEMYAPRWLAAAAGLQKPGMGLAGLR